MSMRNAIGDSVESPPRAARSQTRRLYGYQPITGPYTNPYGPTPGPHCQTTAVVEMRYSRAIAVRGDMNRRRHALIWFFPAIAGLVSLGARADNFGRVRYDKQTDRLIVTMIYRGSNPNHQFSLKWGKCQSDQGATTPGVTLEILDDQFNDQAQQDYQKTVRFAMAGLPCPRPIAVTLKTAPRFFYTLTIPRN